MKYENKTLLLLDQTLLPVQSVYLKLKTVQGVYQAIKKMQVRGAPAIGICAAYGLAIAANAAPATEYSAFMEAFLKDADYLASARPTAVNLFWAIQRMKAVAQKLKGQPVSKIIASLEDEARRIEEEDAENNRKIGESLLSLLHDGDTVLTHCNAGILATSKYGTALSPIYLAKEKGMNIKVYADETRPFFQGSRLTAYELYESGIDVTVICDNMAAMVMSKGWIDCIIVGCDRVARNGDVANKIGTYNLSILAKYFQIPFYVAAPTSTIDMECESGKDIPIEERDGLEVICRNGIWTAPENVKVYNPAFDVTPAGNITAVVTEKGIAYPNYTESFKRLLSSEV
jgi:methylthioribose-1-phosphate isomerase